jgi:hypothetical protein
MKYLSNPPVTITVNSNGQSGKGQKGGFFLSALAGMVVPAIISAIAGQGGSGFSPYKPQKQKNKYAYLK